MPSTTQFHATTGQDWDRAHPGATTRPELSHGGRDPPPSKRSRGAGMPTHFDSYPFQDKEGRQEQTPRQGRGEGSPLGPRAQATRHSGAARRGRGKGDKPPPSGGKEYAPTLKITNLFRVPSSCHLGVIQPGGPAGGAPPE